MKNIQTLKAAALAAFTMAGGAMTAQAQITIPTVTVGNVDNAADSSGYGAVGYSYAISTYEVTNTQYSAFLNAVATTTDTFSLYNTSMGSSQFGGINRTGGSGSYVYETKSGFENKPVNYVSFWDAARFANWLNNGQGGASTETGSYTLGNVTNPVNSSVTRTVGANWVVASENEWYKAAYYDPTKNGGVGGYWLHATQSDTLGNNTAFSATNGANYNDGDYANGGFSGPGTTDVGAYANADSFYGTFDQGGNVWEWNDTQLSSTRRGLRGGSWDVSEDYLRSSSRGGLGATNELDSIGFRVASLAPIPEPSTFGAAMGAMALGVVMMRRRKARGTL
jgi:formylglycine-generating enzyme